MSILHILIVGFLCSETIILVSCSRHRREETVQTTQTKILSEILKPGAVHVRPKGINNTDNKGDPTNVGVNMLIRSISDLDDHKMEFNVQLTLRCFWEDERLQFYDHSGKVPYLTITDTSSVWVPDLFFRNEKEGHFHNILLPNTYLRIYPDGKVLYSTRLSVTLICPMNLKFLPFDVQKCQLLLASFSLTDKDLLLSWKNVHPVQISQVLLMKVFTLEKFKTSHFMTDTQTGNYSCLDVDLIFRREFRYYQIMAYIPCSMLVIVSWITFWFDGSGLGSKVALGVTVLLTMTIVTLAINQSLPPVSYTKAIDVWTGVSLTFVFGVLLEIALICYFLNREKNQDLKNTVSKAGHLEEESSDNVTKSQNQNTFKDLSLEEEHIIEKNRRSPSNKFLALILSKFPSKWSSRIDFISRIAFPVFFAIFTIAYFATYKNTNIDDWYYPVYSNVKEQSTSFSMEV